MTDQNEYPKSAYQNADTWAYIRGLILLIGILAGLWVTFLHPPLILTGGSGTTVNARARCAIVGEEYRATAPKDAQLSENSWGFGVSPEVESEAKKRTKDCLKLATVNVPNVFLQVFVITAVTWLLMNFTRIIK